MKRFWKEARAKAAENGFGVDLDGRPVRTPARALLIVPTQALAQAIAAEWNALGQEVNPRALPLTGLANAALDRIAPDLAAQQQALARYGESDLVAYRAVHPDALVARQAALWDPVLAWAEKRHGARLKVITGIMHQPQPAEALEALQAALCAHNPYETAALIPLVSLTGSLLLGLMLADGAIGPEEAWKAGQLDELWQAEHWGEDSLAEAARAEKKAAFDAGWRFWGLLHG